MFGEDYPTLWNDCIVEHPSCTLEFVDIHGKTIPTDCGPSKVWPVPQKEDSAKQLDSQFLSPLLGKSFAILL
jgi:hypothetical protein